MGHWAAAFQTLVTGDYPDWQLYSTSELYVELQNPNLFLDKDPRTICAILCTRPSLITTLSNKAIEAWDSDSLLAANIIHSLRVFLSWVYAERIPYGFLFQTEVSEEEQGSESAFRRLVPTIFHFQDEVRTVYISIPQSSVYDRQTEYNHLLEEIFINFPTVHEHIVRTNQRLILYDKQGNLMNIDSITQHYTNSPQDVLVDPFQPKPQEFTVLELNIVTSEGDIEAPIPKFLSKLCESIVRLSTGGDREIKLLHSSLEFIVTALSSHLFYMDGPVSEVKYDSFKRPPALDILMRQDPATCQMIARICLDTFVIYYEKEQEKFFLSRWFISEDPNSMHSIECKLGRLSLILYLLLQTYNSPTNPFKLRNLDISWNGLYNKIISHLDDRIILLLLQNLIYNHISFRTYLLAMADPENFLEALARDLYKQEENTDKVSLYINMIIQLILSQDSLFYRYIHSEIILDEVNWLNDYNCEKISLGSLVLLGILKVFRDNLRLHKDDYIHSISSACLYNISEHALSLHDLTAMNFLSLIKGIYNSVNKQHSQHPTSSDYEMSLQLLMLFIDLLSKMLQATYTHNPSLIYAVLLHSEIFVKLHETYPDNKNLALIHEMIEGLIDKIEGEVDAATISNHVKMLNLSCDLEMQYFRGVLIFEYQEEPKKWEEAIIPWLWSKGVSNGIKLFKSDSILFYKT